MIVDITTTGATLKANALKVLDDGILLRSEANLVASHGAAWTSQHVATARALLSRIAAEERARLSRDVAAVFPHRPDDLLDQLHGAFAAEPLADDGTGALGVRCPASSACEAAEWLLERGATSVRVSRHEYLYEAANPLMDLLLRRVAVRAA